MKKYNEYLNNITVNEELHKMIVNKAAQKPSKRRIFQIAGGLTCAAALLVGALVIPGMLNNRELAINPGELGLANDPPSHVLTHNLTFNMGGEQMAALSVDRPVGFSLELTSGQLSEVFPTLHARITATAFYYFDGTLLDVSAFYHNGARILIANERVERTVIMTFADPPQVSYIHGVPVTAYAFGGYNGGAAHIQAEFMLGNVAYHIEISDTLDIGKERMIRLVNDIILGGAANLSVLENPDIPELAEMRNDRLTLQEAQEDFDFGAFMPIAVPAQFAFSHATRTVNHFTNSLFAFWDDGTGDIRWYISRPTPYDFARLVSVNDPEKFDLSLYTIPWMDSVPHELIEYVINPVFLAEELTLEVIQARAQANRMGGYSITFSVLYSGVVVNVNTSGVTPQQVWEMFHQSMPELGMVSPIPSGEILSLYQAQQDAAFGEYLPMNIPAGFEFEHARRVQDEHSNSLHAFWDGGMSSIRWHIATPTEQDFARVVSVYDREKFDLSLYTIPWMNSVPQELMQYVSNPVFLTEELTLEVIQSRVQESRMGYSIIFSVLHNGVLVNINTNGVTPQQLWAMLF